MKLGRYSAEHTSYSIHRHSNILVFSVRFTLCNVKEIEQIFKRFSSGKNKCEVVIFRPLVKIINHQNGRNSLLNFQSTLFCLIQFLVAIFEMQSHSYKDNLLEKQNEPLFLPPFHSVFHIYICDKQVL